MSWLCTRLVSVFAEFRHSRLSYREWIPYDYSSYIVFSVMYAHQSLSTFYCATINVACDALICGLLMHVCCQIEILEYRLKKLLKNQNTLDYCIYHHNSIFELVIYNNKNIINYYRVTNNSDINYFVLYFMLFIISIKQFLS